MPDQPDLPEIPIPRKLTQEVHDNIVQATAAGNYREVAAQYAGIGRTTFFRWMQEGEAADESDQDCPQRDLWNAVKSAQARAEVRDITLIETAAGNGSWQAAAWRLERMYPNRWGRIDRQEVRASVTVERGALSVEEEAREMAAFGMGAASAVALGPEAVEAPPNA